LCVVSIFALPPGLEPGIAD